VEVNLPAARSVQDTQGEGGHPAERGEDQRRPQGDQEGEQEGRKIAHGLAGC
jgi:hypothetical protein